jgi:hypothetical protein
MRVTLPGIMHDLNHQFERKLAVLLATMFTTDELDAKAYL